MGIVQAFEGAIRGTFADQWKEIITTGDFGEHVAVAPAILKTKKKKSANNKGSEDVISNGSKIYVPENTVAVIFDQSGIEEIIKKPGGYVYKKGQSSVFNGDGIRRSIFEQIRERTAFGGISPDEKRIAFVNLREIRDIKFGTKGPQVYNDAFYGTDLEILAYGSFSIKIDNPELFLKNYVPANASYYCFDVSSARDQMLSDFMQSFIVALNTLSGNYRISQLSGQANKISAAILVDGQNAGTWPDRFGFSIVKVSIENIKYTDESRELIRQYSENKMKLKAYEDISQGASDIAAQQKIADGIQTHGFGNTGGMVLGMNMAQSLNNNARKMDDSGNRDKPIEDKDDVIVRVRKFKQLLDEGIITDEEFAAIKRKLFNTDGFGRDRDSSRVEKNKQPQNNETVNVKDETVPVRMNTTFTQIAKSQYRVGGHVVFNGDSWCVLANSLSKYLLLKDEPIGAISFHTSAQSVTWENASLREWLNTEYYSGLEDSIKKAVLRIPLRPEKNKEWTPKAGDPTDDYVFCLGFREYKKYAVPVINIKWWLRSPGRSENEAAVVDESGEVISCQTQREDIFVRPAIWVDIDKL